MHPARSATIIAVLIASLSVAACSTVLLQDDFARGVGPVETSFFGVVEPAAERAGHPLGGFASDVVLVVNVASECGFTPQYAGLQALHDELGTRGFRVLGFPCDDFGGQEPGSLLQIEQFCSSEFGVTFPLADKVVIDAGPDQSPAYAHLEAAMGELPSWNFCKYLIGRDGRVRGYFNSFVEPDDERLRVAIVAALDEPAPAGQR